MIYPKNGTNWGFWEIEGFLEKKSATNLNNEIKLHLDQQKPTVLMDRNSIKKYDKEAL